MGSDSVKSGRAVQACYHSNASGVASDCTWVLSYLTLQPRSSKPLIKEYALNHTSKIYMINGILLNQGVLKDLGSWIQKILPVSKSRGRSGTGRFQ